MSSNNQIKLNDYKNFKHLYKIKTIKQCVENKPLVLFYQYNSLNSSTKTLLTKFLKLNGFNSLVLKNTEVRSVLQGDSFKDLRNMLTGNILLIHTDNLDNLNKKFITEISKKYHLILMGGIYGKKVYREKQIKKLVELDSNIQKQSVIVLNNPLNLLKQTISYLKK